MVHLSKTMNHKVSCDRRKLRKFLRRAVFQSSLLGQGEAVSDLHLALVRTMSVRKLAEEMIGKAIAGPGGCEFRLNGAGFKLFISLEKSGLRVRLGGDQAKEYPDLCEDLNTSLEELGLLA